MLSPMIAAAAATTITWMSDQWSYSGRARNAAVISAVSPGIGTPADSIATAAKSSTRPYCTRRSVTTASVEGALHAFSLRAPHDAIASRDAFGHPERDDERRAACCTRAGDDLSAR